MAKCIRYEYDQVIVIGCIHKRPFWINQSIRQKP